MINKKIFQWAVPAGTLLFSLIFWKEKMGVNTLIYLGFILGALYLTTNRDEWTSSAKATMIGTVIAGIMVVINNSLLSKWVLFVTAFIMVGFIYRKDLKFIGFAFLTTFRQFFGVPVQSVLAIIQSRSGIGTFSKFKKGIDLGLIPFVLFVLFYSLYYNASPKFAGLSNSYWGYIGSFFSGGSSTLPVARLFFTFLGLLLTGALLWKPQNQWLSNLQLLFKDNIIRKRGGTIAFFDQKITPVSLKNESKAAFLLIAALNVLLFFVNITDIAFVWFNFSPLSPAELSNFVHEGTFVLIFSILLSMAILLYHFRGNLNFLVGTKPLKIAALMWICQNCLLAFSVGMRNYHYIANYGLTYKRIGVMFFLVMTLSGLILLWLKIRDRKSGYFVVHRMGWMLYLVMILSTFVNWDIQITRYNLSLNSQYEIDAWFLAKAVSDKNLYLLDQYEDKLYIKNKPNGNNRITRLLHEKRDDFENDMHRFSWLSWNLADYRNQRYLISNH